MLNNNIKNKLTEDLKRVQKGCRARTIKSDFIIKLLDDNKELIKNMVNDNIVINTLEIRQGGERGGYNYIGTHANIYFKGSNVKEINVFRSTTGCEHIRINCTFPQDIDKNKRRELCEKYNINKVGNLYI